MQNHTTDVNRIILEDFKSNNNALMLFLLLDLVKLLLQRFILIIFSIPDLYNMV